MENSTELQKPNVEAEVYSSNKKCDWGKKKFKSLIGFHRAIKPTTTTEEKKKRKKEKKNPKDSTEQVKNKNYKCCSWVTAVKSPLPCWESQSTLPP